MKDHTYLGYQQGDLGSPLAKYYNESIASIPGIVSEALSASPLKDGSLPPLSRAGDLAHSMGIAIENGYTLEPDGSLRVAVLTSMPGVTPAMWDWWFGWHGCSAQRYKLWHPKAHVDARWQDGSDDDTRYVGRVSLIAEYIGKKLEKAAIRFVPPNELGIPPTDKSDAVYICARLGYAQLPIDFGWLVHQVKAVEGGAVMRSRFWMGGRHIAIRWGWLPGFFSKILQKSVKLPEQQAIDLMTHCSEEMNHLAGILPNIYQSMNVGIKLVKQQEHKP